MPNTERVVIIKTRHLELDGSPRQTPATTPAEPLDVDLVDAVENGRITLRRARTTQATRAAKAGQS